MNTPLFFRTVCQRLSFQKFSKPRLLLRNLVFTFFAFLIPALSWADMWYSDGAMWIGHGANYSIRVDYMIYDYAGYDDALKAAQFYVRGPGETSFTEIGRYYKAKSGTVHDDYSFEAIRNTQNEYNYLHHASIYCAVFSYFYPNSWQGKDITIRMNVEWDIDNNGSVDQRITVDKTMRAGEFSPSSPSNPRLVQLSDGRLGYRQSNGGNTDVAWTNIDLLNYRYHKVGDVNGMHNTQNAYDGLPIETNLISPTTIHLEKFFWAQQRWISRRVGSLTHKGYAYPYITSCVCAISKKVDISWVNNRLNESETNSKLYVLRAPANRTETTPYTLLTPSGLSRSTTMYSDTDPALVWGNEYIYTVVSLPNEMNINSYLTESLRKDIISVLQHSKKIILERTPIKFDKFAVVAYKNEISPKNEISWDLEWTNDATTGGVWLEREEQTSINETTGAVIFGNLKRIALSKDQMFYTNQGATSDGVVGGSAMSAVSNGFQYRYRLVVDFQNRVTESEWKSVSLFDAPVFSNFKATKGSIHDRVRLTWTVDRLDLIEEFIIYRRSFSETTSDNDPWTLIQILDAKTKNNTYEDLSILPGFLYQYKIQSKKLLQSPSTLLVLQSTDSEIGFITQAGTVSGRITYGAGTSVKDVSVTVQSDAKEKSLYRSMSFEKGLNQSGKINLSPDKHGCVLKGFTFQLWVKPIDAGSSDAAIYELQDEFSLWIEKNNITVYLSDISKTTPILSAAIRADKNDYFNISTSYDASLGKMSLYFDGELVGEKILSSSDKSKLRCHHLEKVNAQLACPLRSTASNQYYKGRIDEIRLWGRALSSAEISSNVSNYMNGNEEGLIGYWPLDEGVSNISFDRSNTNGIYNEHTIHFTGAVSNTDVPSPKQLTIKSVTDANGNYLIKGIPYWGDGTTYSIVPMFGVHQFEPTMHLRYIGTNSAVHNATDFKDISSFPVSGTVVYEGGNYPVEACNFYIDGNILVNSEGQPITTDFQGRFTIDVPIGKHKVQLRKQGHQFENNGFLVNSSGEDLIYNDKVSGVILKDQTRIKFLGRVIGGLREEAKPLGFGLSVNNIGNNNKLILNTVQPEYQLRSGQDTTFIAFHKEEAQIHTNSNKNAYMAKTNTYEISVDSVSGEFVAWVQPIRYNLTRLSVLGEDILGGITQILDFTNSVNLQYETREIEDTNGIKYTDSTRFHSKYTYTHRVAPNFSITELSQDGKIKEMKGVSYLGESQIIYENTGSGKRDTIPLVKVIDGQAQYLLGKPFYVQGAEYFYDILAYEQYTFDKVPLTKGTLRIDNTMKVLTNKIEEVVLDEKGKALYSFMGGAPDLTNGLKKFEAVLNTNDRDYAWSGNFTTYLAGSRSTGSNFTTAGPAQIHFVLRDPPGSLSSMSIEKGSTFSNTYRNQVNTKLGTSLGLELDLGAKVITWAGFGAGVIVESEAIAEVNTDITSEQAFSVGTETVNTITFNKTYSSSSDPLWVGDMADVFVGNATNIIYGLCDAISLAPISDKEKFDVIFMEDEEQGYVFGKASSLAVGQTYGTHFVYTQEFIESSFIPNLIALRNNLFVAGPRPDPEVISKPVYWSKLPKSDPRFGSSNTDIAVWGLEEVLQTKDVFNGKSYEIIFPAVQAELKRTYVDTVHWYNNQVKQWEFVLAENEKTKLLAPTVENVSFTAGTSYTSGYTSSESKQNFDEWEFMVNGEVASRLGFEICGISSVLSTKTSVGGGKSGSSSYEKQTEITVSYILEEDGDDDYLSVDIKKTPDGGYAFRTVAGQTQCPYEGQSETKYYKPGSVLNSATMQIEVPKISVVSSQATNIPANRKAVFHVDLKNESESQTDMIYGLFVDNNPDGATLKVDGKALGSLEGISVVIPAGEVLRKTITLEKGPVAMDYRDIEISLCSQCQWDPTTPWEPIEDHVSVSASFIPNCSDISMTMPQKNWVMNAETGDSLYVRLQNFDRNFPKFGYVKLLYKAHSSSLWNNAMTFYTDINLFKEAQSPKFFIPTTQDDIKYWLKLPNIDQTYDIQAVAYCIDGQGAVIAETPSEMITGVRDMQRPKVFGNIQPADGILSIGDEISIQFNEALNEGLITRNNFTVKGVRNGGPLHHENSLQFDGTSSVMTTEHAILLGGSFTMSAWVKRNAIGSATVLSHGSFASLGFDANNRLRIVMNGQSFQSAKTYENTEEFMHLSLAYNSQDGSFEAMVNDEIVCEGFCSNYYLNEKLSVGANPNSDFFKGWIHEVRLWKRKLEKPEIYSLMYSSLSGTERDLIGYWPMTEGKGSVAKDKARYRHLIGKATWSVDPKGFALKLNSNSSAKLNTASTIIIPDDKDFSFEMWFKGSPQTNACLFSCGRGDSLDYVMQNKLSLFVNDKGEMVLMSHHRQHIISEKNYMDNQWHHIAVVINRAGMASFYIDQELKQSVSSVAISGLSAANMYIGKRVWNEQDKITGLVSEKSDMDFVGSVDEVRFWSAALSTSLLEHRSNTRLHGDEAALIAYYPFDKYFINNMNMKELIFSEEDQYIPLVGSNSGKLEVKNAVSTELTPNIKGIVFLDNLDYDYAVNTDKIIITLKEEPQRIANTDVMISMKNIVDKNGNESSGEYVWSALVDNISLLWTESELMYKREVNKAFSFTTSIRNKEGKPIDYTIEDIPSYLSVFPKSGKIAANATQVIQFTVNADINIGNYEEFILLTNQSNLTADVLKLNISITGTPPDWKEDPNNSELSMRIISLVKKNDQIMGHPEDLMAVFDGMECIGVEHPSFIEKTNTYMYFLTISGKPHHIGKTLSFKYWEALTGNVYILDHPKTYCFEADAAYGTPSEALVFQVTDLYDQNLSLAKGWNWIAMNGQAINPEINAVFVNAKAGSLTNVKSQTEFAVWADEKLKGTLTQILPTKMYMLNNQLIQSIDVQAKALSDREKTIQLSEGWNWIGYTLLRNQSINDALSGLNASQNDMIRSQTKFSVYDSLMGWVGNLTVLQPNMGYKMKVAKSASFKFSEAAIKKVPPLAPKAATHFEVNQYDFEHSMNLIGGLYDEEGNLLAFEGEVGFFVGNQCRGYATAQSMNGTNASVFFATMYSNKANGDTMTVKLYNAQTSVETKGLAKFVFVADQLLGSIEAPVDLNAVADSTSIEKRADTDKYIIIYPNPVQDILQIKSEEPIESLQILDMHGRQVLLQKADVDHLNVQELPRGSYILHIQTKTRNKQLKFVKN